MASWRTIGGGLGAALGIAGSACDGGGGHGGGLVTIPGVDLAPAFGSARFSRPVKLVQHPTQDDRWYVVEQGGRVRTFTNASNSAIAANLAGADAEFVDDGERGLLGMAFDPDFDQSGEIYLAYTRADTAVLARWVSRDDGLNFRPDTEAVVLEFRHPQANNNGGDLAFGPDDGFLYYSMGDGGGFDDPQDNGQDPNVLLGKILRIDVNSTQDGDSYAVPTDNPFANDGDHCNEQTAPATHRCPEIHALGFRNPRRMNFDPTTRKLYVGDEGQDKQDEIDVVVKGGNYGWDCREGELDHSTTVACNASFVPPEVVHGPNEARAITGGAVYRGTAVPALQHFYVYGDLETGFFFAFDVRVADAPPLRLAVPMIEVSAFGQGRDGEVYVVDHSGSPSILKFVPQSG